MKQLTTSVLLVIASTFFTSCETEPVSNTPSADATSRTAPINGKQLRIINDSDLSIDGELYCFGAVNNMTVNSNIKVMGRMSIPSNSDVSYKGFVQASNPELAIQTWYVSTNNSTPLAYSASHVNQAYGQLFAPGLSTSKFANFRYLKVRLKMDDIEGFVPVTMLVELPQFSANNADERVISLTPFGLPQNLHITQSSYINSVGNTVLTFDSELSDQIQ